jgi:hypothetical protein
MGPDPVMPGRSNLFAGRKLLYVIGLALQDKAIWRCDWMCCLPSARSKRQTLQLTAVKLSGGRGLGEARQKRTAVVNAACVGLIQACHHHKSFAGFRINNYYQYVLIYRLGT